MVKTKTTKETTAIDFKIADHKDQNGSAKDQNGSAKKVVKKSKRSMRGQGFQVKKIARLLCHEILVSKDVSKVADSILGAVLRDLVRVATTVKQNARRSMLIERDIACAIEVRYPELAEKIHSKWTHMTPPVVEPSAE
jgi:histone H3/H4